ncbi:MAG: hypothetical protein H6Q89_739 [Myxococcaceae bacterium]|nr:hypothetical protein [Myxococcaceae bacterium]
MKLQDVSRYFRDGQVSLAKKSLAFLAALYGVMPLDAIPDVLPMVGWLDDVGVIAAVTAYIWRDVKKHAAARLASSNPAR